MVNNIFKKLTRSEEQMIEALFHQKLKDGKKKKEVVASAQWWRDVIADFFISAGHDIFTSELREIQDRVINRGMSAEYVSALLQVVDASPTISEHDRVVLLLTASPEEHEKALAKIGFR